MGLLLAFPLSLFANTTASSAASVMHSFVDPVIGTMCVVASLVCAFFIATGGYHYMTSSGKPDNLENAKKIIRNALIGLVIVLGAATLTAILSHAYGSPSTGATQQMPALSPIQPQPAGGGLADVLIKAITGLLQNIVESIANPFMKALNYFTGNTPLMAANGSVLKLWLAIVGITDALFVLVVALLGFHVMSYATFGMDEIEFKHLLPQIGLVFLLFNTSIFVIDGVIELSNAMIHALNAVFPTPSVWGTLSKVAKESGSLGIAALLIMVVFLALSVILLVYYVGRLVTLYLGAILSPLLVLLWIVPGFKDFVETAIKVYLVTIFVLFIHVVILRLAASIFAGLVATGPNHTPDPLMALIVGLATVIALLKTQGVLMQLSYVSIGPRTARKLGGQFATAVSYVADKGKQAVSTARDRSSSQPSDNKGSSSTNGNDTSSSSGTAAPRQTQNYRPKRAATGSTTAAPASDRVFGTGEDSPVALPRKLPTQEIISRPVKAKQSKGKKP
ncbi:MAG TPA: hypothetical protein VGG13_00115 [Candidatus Saccharimonadales bacterium]|jgi:hypothetical protein